PRRRRAGGHAPGDDRPGGRGPRRHAEGLTPEPSASGPAKVIALSTRLGYVRAMSETRWLDAEEMAIWRDWLVTSTRIAEALDRDLQEPFGRSMAEYEVLVQLSAAEGRRMRMA